MRLYSFSNSMDKNHINPSH